MNQELLEQLQTIRTQLEKLIDEVPAGDTRNSLINANIILLAAELGGYDRAKSNARR